MQEGAHAVQYVEQVERRSRAAGSGQHFDSHCPGHSGKVCLFIGPSPVGLVGYLRAK
jgi:hypothetical protein